MERQTGLPGVTVIPISHGPAVPDQSPPTADASESTHSTHRSALCPAVLCTAVFLAAPALAGPTRVSINVGVEIETRGPVHEAFAEPVVYDPEPYPVVPQAPPPLIDEIPPDQRPAGDSVSWISGYWSWDEDRRDFLWVSGVWRNMPPDRQFIPGYWAQTAGGHQWVSGSWVGASVETIEYLPEPPPPLSVEPVGPPPSINHTWVPGMWVWRQGRYVWQPGYWLTSHVDWVWVPAHYIWTPSGYVYVSGYWDHPVKRRGVLFAPARVERTVYSRPGFAYSPSVVIDADILVDHLFARPRCRHYYFGDYYAPEYQRIGILPVSRFHRSTRGYSPLYAQALSVHMRSDPQWERRHIREYEMRRDHADARPPRSWAALERARAQRGPGPDDMHRSRTLALARPLSELTRTRDTSEGTLHFQPVAPRQRDSYLRESTKLRDYLASRRQTESLHAAKGPLRRASDSQHSQDRAALLERTKPGQPRERAPRVESRNGPLRLALPGSPIVSRRSKDAQKSAEGQPSTAKPDRNGRPARQIQPRERKPAPAVISKNREPNSKDRDKGKAGNRP